LWHIALLRQSPWIAAFPFRKGRERLVSVDPVFLGFVILIMVIEYLESVNEAKFGISQKIDRKKCR
jgi:hypothetical protein